MDNNERQGTPLVSVIMPAYNAEAFIEEAISSVLAQSVSDLELIVIDDCSTDSTYEITKAMEQKDVRIRVLRNEQNCGVARTRNRGIAESNGTYVAMLDSDDKWYPHKLASQLELMEHTGADLCYCSYEIIDASGNCAKADYLVPERMTFEDLIKENAIQCSAMLIRAEVIRKYRFNTEFYHEDYILGLDILRNGHMAVGCREILLSWRYLENSRSFNKWNSAKHRWTIYRKYLNMPPWRSVRAFGSYAIAGLRKYR